VIFGCTNHSHDDLHTLIFLAVRMPEQRDLCDGMEGATARLNVFRGEMNCSLNGTFLAAWVNFLAQFGRDTFLARNHMAVSDFA
jgi:hypothetical protein